MIRSQLGASTRIFANLLTFALSVFGAWGWLAKIQSWPPGVSDLGWLVLATLTLATQQLANGAASRAFMAFQAGLWITGVGGVVLALLFASITGHSAEGAWMTTLELQRAERVAPVAAAIAAAEAELESNYAALRALPSNIPGSRLVILQRPLDEAVARGEARLDDLRAEMNTLTALPLEDNGAHRLIWLLGLAEVALYWLLAAGETSQQGVASRPHVPSADVPDRERVPPRRASRPRPGGRVPRAHRASRNLLAALAWFMPGAAYPPARDRDTQIVAAAAPAGGTPNTAETTVGSHVQSHMPGGRSARSVPAWLDHARDLRAAGLSYRRIAREVETSKSSVGRWLKRD